MTSTPRILIRVAGLDTMLVIQGPRVTLASAVDMIRSVVTVDSFPMSNAFYAIFTKLVNALPATAATEVLDPHADYLIRVDNEKLLVRKTLIGYRVAPGWTDAVSKLIEIYPTQGSLVRRWSAGDPSLKALEELEAFIGRNPALGAEFCAELRTRIAKARR